ncbi:non-homologous end-joining DNA ligase [Nonomuraea sp. 3-1Str]|uniref:non-homologous end-joining DNA ligase n=1 Tax=Nonomuraea sp. 3-1Str TaxID=2929801 RepID=UPI0028551F43|nr:non-homologous end-joining DNA ligase [Nonomuraea sp. 3-1Str]MDR8412722.1 non-homologous end-joining DNA ligase [Nonomuraea sp. 3-1Str]
MLAVPGELPKDRAGYGLEVKWDGIRALLHLDGGLRLTGRHGADYTRRYPEISVREAKTAAGLGVQSAVIDGELVAFDPRGRPSFTRLQRRMNLTDPEPAVLRLHPITFLPFDLLYLDGTPLLDLPYRDRRGLLDELDAGAPPYFPGESDLLAATREQGLEGVVAKRLDSPYRPGERSPWWVKVKHLRTTEVVVGGWKPGKGRRAGGIGSLLMGVFTGEGLRYVGHVGTGFTDATLDELYALLAPLEIRHSPFGDPVPWRNRWVRPDIVGEVAYTMWTDDLRLRHPVWRGLRPDKIPAEVTL